MHCSKLRLFAALAAAWILLCAMSVCSAAPLLQEGKKTLYQRVISHPEAVLHADADEGSTVVNGKLRTFTPLYVYQRGGDWLEVGVSTTQPDGWIRADKTTPWNSSLTLLFTDRSEREPVVFFDGVKDLETLCEADDMEARLEKMMSELRAGRSVAGVTATEPLNAAVSSKNFYLMPIMQMQEPYDETKFLQVVSIAPGKGDDAGKTGTQKTGIAIVIDTTASMGPYIERCKQLVKRVFDRLEKDKLSEHVAFAVVAFRNSTAARPEVEYTTRVISDFTTASDRAALESRLSELRECTASTHSFAEDSLAGVYTAVNELSWKDYDSRLILLITDAGPLPASDPYRSVSMEPAELNDYVTNKGLYLVAVHVKTPEGQKDHASAEKAYRTLSMRDGRAQYQSLRTSNNGARDGADFFVRVADSLATNMAKMVSYTAEGKMVTRPEDEARSSDESPEHMALRLGYSMQLEYFGKVQNITAPEIVNSWITDMDLRRLAKGDRVPAVEVAVMLTKNQLSDLHRQVQIIIDQAERTKKTDSKDFFSAVLSASARAVRDPNAPVGGQNLAQLGVLGEYLEGLPYTSDVMTLTEEDWYRKSIGEQTAFINRLKSKLARYEEYDRDQDAWESFGMASGGDWVCRIPLSMLP